MGEPYLTEIKGGGWRVVCACGHVTYGDHPHEGDTCRSCGGAWAWRPMIHGVREPYWAVERPDPTSVRVKRVTKGTVHAGGRRVPKVPPPSGSAYAGATPCDSEEQRVYEVPASVLEEARANRYKAAIAKVIIDGHARMLTQYQGRSTNENVLRFAAEVRAALDGVAIPEVLGLSGDDAERVREILEGVG